MNFSVRREKILNFRGLQTENIDFWRSGRRPGELWEGPRGRFPSVLVVLKKFREVFGGSDEFWTGFRRFSKGFKWFLEDFRRPSLESSENLGFFAKLRNSSRSSSNLKTTKFPIKNSGENRS